MEERPIRILLVEDNEGDARLLRELLLEARSFPHALTHVERLEAARSRMEAEGADVVLLDLSLPDAHGLETVSRMLATAPDAPIIVLTGLDDDDIAVRAVHAGAQDYLVKGHVDGGVLARSIRYACERKRLEQERGELLRREREARAAAEAAVRARDEVLRIVSHDLGNSLSALLVTAEVLLRTHTVEPGERTQRRLENIRAMAEQMQRLRQDLLDVAMIEAGRLSIEPREIAPGAVVEQACERFAALALDKSVALVCRVPDAPRPVLADDARLGQVLSNLLANAIRFTPSRGEVAVGVERSETDTRFFVTDSGPGIPEEDLPRLFDRFWTTKAGNPQGAGLGLAIAKGIVEAHGGRIWAERGAAGGSTFFFTIPSS
ncbi:MAG TPA: hybrid sensor histidine kinase/response regulator [Longimicrobiales bacterium]|nr:hybrid sensor histidine kinase/response regulator [Longimicrobiales bacterium]